MSDRNPFLLIVFHLLHKQVRICLSPISRWARLTSVPTEISTISLVIVRLHECRRASSIRIDCLYAVSYGLLAEPDLTRVIAVPDVLRRATWRPRAGGQITIASASGTNAVPNYAQASSCCGREEVVLTLLLGCCSQRPKLRCPPKSLKDAKAVHLL